MGAFNHCEIDQRINSRLQNLYRIDAGENNFNKVKIEWKKKRKSVCTIEGKKWKNLMKELNWMNRVQTGKYFLKKSSVLVCFGFKCLHSKHPWGQNVQVKISRSPRICFCAPPCLVMRLCYSHTDSFSSRSMVSSPSPQRIS